MDGSTQSRAGRQASLPERCRFEAALLPLHVWMWGIDLQNCTSRRPKCQGGPTNHAACYPQSQLYQLPNKLKPNYMPSVLHDPTLVLPRQTGGGPSHLAAKKCTAHCTGWGDCYVMPCHPPRSPQVLLMVHMHLWHQGLSSIVGIHHADERHACKQAAATVLLPINP